MIIVLLYLVRYRHIVVSLMNCRHIVVDTTCGRSCPTMNAGKCLFNNLNKRRSSCFDEEPLVRENIGQPPRRYSRDAHRRVPSFIFSDVYSERPTLISGGLFPIEDGCDQHRHRAVARYSEEDEHRSDEEVSPDECRVDENGEYCEDGDQYAGDGEHDPLYVPRRGIHAIDVRHMFY